MTADATGRDPGGVARVTPLGRLGDDLTPMCRPYGVSSALVDSIGPRTANVAGLWAPYPKTPISPAAEGTATTRPLPRSTMPGTRP
ncbi:hypothetical protein [Streptomyces turgidiscabies]|uniref:Uncharacterized protein n=1 Tax=Streptomyces turgidiscabies TaxID=85558 RepID=A0ABU0RVZ8_9ACTN|nr:hypothetical protein [Streptomyces turgidiscabies]MDQ0936176.1 hypothetical protein [Streptomyces turgidiscabies]